MKDAGSKEIIENLRESWRGLWREKVDDKIKAEAIANREYPNLFVDRGTVISATRDFRPLSFREILEKHGVVNTDRFIASSPGVGGWGKFIRTMVKRRGPKQRVEETRKDLESKKKKQHLRKRGHGWLRIAR